MNDKFLNMLKGIWIFIFTALLTSVGFSQKDLDIKNGAIELKGTLLHPKKAKILLIIVAGSGPTDRNGNSSALSGQNNSLMYLAEGLESQGLATFRYDKRFLNPVNKVEEGTLRFEDLISDAEVIFSFFKNSGEYDKIGFIGHSEGSLISAIAAKNVKADFEISIAGLSSTADAVLRLQLANLPKDLKASAFGCLDSLAKGSIVMDPPAGLEALFRQSVQPYLISWFRYDPKLIFGSLNCPVMIIQGDNDIQVGVAEANGLKQCNPGAELLLVKGMNHVLKICPTGRLENISSYSDPKLPVPKDLSKAINKFVRGI